MTSIFKKTAKEWKNSVYEKSNFKICIKIHKCQWIKQTEKWCTWRISDKLIWPRNLKKTRDAPGKTQEKVRANKGNGKTESVSKSILNVNNIFFTQKYQFRRKINKNWVTHWINYKSLLKQFQSKSCSLKIHLRKIENFHLLIKGIVFFFFVNSFRYFGDLF